MTEVVGPVVSAISQTDDATKNKIKREVYQIVDEKYGEGDVFVDSSALVICGNK